MILLFDLQLSPADKPSSAPLEYLRIILVEDRL
jgi:hypothetical protein